MPSSSSIAVRKNSLVWCTTGVAYIMPVVGDAHLVFLHWTESYAATFIQEATGNAMKTVVALSDQMGLNAFVHKEEYHRCGRGVTS